MGPVRREPVRDSQWNAEGERPRQVPEMQRHLVRVSRVSVENEAGELDCLVPLVGVMPVDASESGDQTDCGSEQEPVLALEVGRSDSHELLF